MHKFFQPDPVACLRKQALKHPFTNYTVVGHQTSHGTSNQTAMTGLAHLEAKGFLIKRKTGKAFVFSPAADLAARIGGG